MPDNILTTCEQGHKRYLNNKKAMQIIYSEKLIWTGFLSGKGDNKILKLPTSYWLSYM